MTTLRGQTTNRKLWVLLVILLAIGLALLLGYKASTRWLLLLLAVIAVIVILKRPLLGLLALLAGALLVGHQFNTGTAVTLNVAALLLPLLLGLWFVDMVRRKDINLVPSPTYLPLILFLLASLLSLLIGIATWDPLIPRPTNFLLVQMAQWAIFALSVGAFFLTANLIRSEDDLRTLTLLFLFITGAMVLLRFIPGVSSTVNRHTTAAFNRAPLWALMAALAGGQLLFNNKLKTPWRVFLLAVVGYAIYYSFYINRGSSSTWIGVGVALSILLWLRYPRLRWLVVLVVIATAVAGLLFPAIWNFAGGDDAWFSTGGSRIALIQRVIEVTMRNPLTGLGPAAYRLYANAEPLVYEHIIWNQPRVSSHNNYVDIFSHGGILGLILLAWFCWEFYRLGMRLHHRLSAGFSAGYVNAMLAMGASSLALMLFADWILPFVYNIGFPGFQASVLVWLFMGGLVAIDHFLPEDQEPQKP
jgi:O-antigen ligase